MNAGYNQLSYIEWGTKDNQTDDPTYHTELFAAHKIKSMRKRESDEDQRIMKG